MKVKKELEQKVLEAIKEALKNMDEEILADVNNDWVGASDRDPIFTIYYGENALNELVDDCFERDFSDAFNNIADLNRFKTNARFYSINIDGHIICSDTVLCWVNFNALAKYILENTEAGEGWFDSGYYEIDHAINKVLKEEGV